MHWLTYGSSAEAERNLTLSTQVSTRTPLIQGSNSTENEKDSELSVELAVHGLLKEPPSALAPNAVVVDLRKDGAADTILSAPLRGI